jgi:hypothetical protein
MKYRLRCKDNLVSFSCTGLFSETYTIANYRFYFLAWLSKIFHIMREEAKYDRNRIINKNGREVIRNKYWITTVK